MAPVRQSPPIVWEENGQNVTRITTRGLGRTLGYEPYLFCSAEERTRSGGDFLEVHLDAHQTSDPL